MPSHAQLQRPAPAADRPPPASERAAQDGGQRLAVLADALNAAPRNPSLQAAVQRRQNRTGLPDNLKSGIEALSGHSLDPVRVHFNSARPAGLQAHAIAQGHDIHLAPGQERHLPHEAWHVAQQMQGRVRPTTQMHGVAVNDDPALEAEADRMGGQAMQMRAAPQRPLTAALLSTTALTPVQRWSPWDLVPSWQTTKTAVKSLAVGGAVAGGLALAGLATPVALGIGAASALATKVGGVGSGIGAGVLGGLSVATGGVLPVIGGAVASGILGTAGTLFGGTIGADLQSAATSHPKTMGTRTVPTTGDTTTIRAYERAQKLAHPGNVTQVEQVITQIDSGPLRDYVRNDLATNHGGATQPAKYLALPGIITAYYTNIGRAAAPGAVVKAKTVNAAREALYEDPYIQSILNGKRFKAPPPVAPALSFTGVNTPTVANTARDKFNALVSRPAALPNIGPVVKGLTDPVSYMGHSGKLTVGWGSPSDTIVHEFGHHLENNLAPSEFATLHNFLTARSISPNLRRVGYGHILNKDQTQEGYDTTTPNPDVGGHSSLTRLGVDFLRFGVGSRKGEQGIDRFVQSNAHTPESSYATQVDSGDFKTEFLSTTIHFLADPSNARALIKADPLRVCLFLYFAQRPAYDRVKHKLARKKVNLDTAIKRVT